MKTIYFVRHGQSEANISAVMQQTSETKLTEHGLNQARAVAEHMKKVPLQAIIASTFARAAGTANEIGKATGLPVEHSELFIERRRGMVQLTLPKNHPRWMWVQLQLSLFSRFSWYRHSDEETPEDLLARVREALGFLAHRPEDTIVVVSHGIFMRAVYASIVFGEGVTGRMYLRAMRTMMLRNTALMIATYEDGIWTVTHWNEDASAL